MIGLLMLLALRKAMSYRSDGQPQLKYFLASDFNAKSRPFSFQYGRYTIHGERFSYGEDKPKGVVVFFHGMGAGYTAYTQEICFLARRGYLVYAYDNLGCMTSEGRGINNLCEALKIQHRFFEFLDGEDEAKGLERFAIGHSWGGYAALGACLPEYRISKIVSISGFLSPSQMIVNAEPSMKKFKPLIQWALLIGYGKDGLSVGRRLSKSNAKVFYIQGDKDNIVPLEYGYEAIKEVYGDDQRLTLRLVKGSGHNPYWSYNAQLYFLDLMGNKKITHRDFDNHHEIDYAKLNHDDPSIMNGIVSFLDEKE